MRERHGFNALVHKYVIEFHANIVVLFLCTYEPPFCALVAYRREMNGKTFHNAVGINSYNWQILLLFLLKSAAQAEVEKI